MHVCVRLRSQFSKAQCWIGLLVVLQHNSKFNYMSHSKYWSVANWKAIQWKTRDRAWGTKVEFLITWCNLFFVTRNSIMHKNMNDPIVWVLILFRNNSIDINSTKWNWYIFWIGWNVTFLYEFYISWMRSWYIHALLLYELTDITVMQTDLRQSW